ncbi:MAG TPA: DegT/DnrJ/EryC1/StrS family aminotransferase [Anaerolineae bacterium]|nr:DegT/DnrJ/EryC1/StrS family aminotransferase [Anaerolineae bacterium]HQI83217.1 DegT/DnrJ/EryC1/StrS family aminotransferase [Anaerolineae bacterium]
MRTQLALYGGAPAVPPGTIKKWPPIDDVDRDMVLASLHGDNHAFGPNCEAFQQEFAAWNGNRYALTTNSGTAALHMGVAACDCGAGDEVIVPAYSWSSSVTCVLQHNAIPVFVDIDFDTMNIDVNKIEAAITPKTKAILVVHLHGLMVEIEPVLAVARKYGLKVIEDACQAHGAAYQGKKAGLWGDCAAFSLNQNKNLCSGEGGMFVTDDEDVLHKARMLWSFGETRAPSESRDYHVYAMGWMYRNNDLTAAFGRAQLTKLNGYLAQQRANALRLTEQLQGVPGLILPAEPAGFTHNWYNYVLRFDMDALGHTADARDFRDKLVQALNAEGVPNLVWQHFILPAMTVFQAKNGYGHGCPWSCPHAQPVNYALEQYPVAQQHCDTHTCIVMALRAPNGAEAVDLMAQGIRKVMENSNQL